MAHRFAGALLRWSAAFAILAVALTRPDASLAQGARNDPRNDPRYEVTGFRDARFGMTEFEVRAAARNSFGVKDDEMTVVASAVDGITKLIVHVPMLEPGLGAGRVEYFFGYKSHALIQVDVVWGLDTNPPRSNSAMIAVAARLQRYFLGFNWGAKTVRAGIPIDDNAVLLFGGEDSRKGAVSVVMEGVSFDLGPNGVVRFYPERAAPPKLVVSYTAAQGQSDIRTVSRGDF